MGAGVLPAAGPKRIVFGGLGEQITLEAGSEELGERLRRCQPNGVELLEDLEARGLIQDTTDREALAAMLAEGPVTLYCGFDPTADSLHVGNLIGLLTLRRFQLAGHRPISLAGGATGMVGDPSGRSEERNLLDDSTLAANLAGIVPQLEKFLDFEPGPNQAKLVDNRAWTVGVGVLDFLRDVGKHVTVNQMLARESVKSRLAGSEGLSYTEFSYMLLQGYDYLWLFENEGCRLQIGGSDQWGNIVLGVDLIRRKHRDVAHALTWPLLTRADGTKYGKTAGGETMWLSPARMSPYRFYQGWIGVDDSDVRRLLLQLTFLPVEDIDLLMAEHEQAPHRRAAQTRLALEVTALVHGKAAAEAAREASSILFGGGMAEADSEVFEILAAEVPTTRTRAVGVTLIDLLTATGLATSRSDARRAIEQGAIYVNGERVAEIDRVLDDSDLRAGGNLLLRRGKKNYHLVR